LLATQRQRGGFLEVVFGDDIRRHFLRLGMKGKTLSELTLGNEI
jgi:hypothetical protein